MRNHISQQARPDCYAILWTYGEICCHSNCCGQFGKGLKMWKARLVYHKCRLDELQGYLKTAKKEKDTIAINNFGTSIELEKRRIKKVNRWIKYFKQKGVKK